MSRLKIVVPGDSPPQIQGSPHLERLKPYGDVVLYTDRPETREAQLRPTRDADILINSWGLVKWPDALLQRLPKLKLISLCSVDGPAWITSTFKEKPWGLMNSNPQNVVT